MCGISGYYDSVNSIASLNESLNILQHRGPDDSGIYIDNSSNIGMGHRRLSIIDTSTFGHQPMLDSKEKIVSKQEAILWLRNWLSKTETQTIYQNIEDPDQEFFEELLESTYELEIKLGYVIKWFAVRIEPD